MRNRKIETLHFLISDLKISQKFNEFFWKLTFHSSNFLKDLLCNKNCMRYLKWNHINNDPAAKDYCGSFRINENIKFSCWCLVSLPNGSSHNCDSFDFLLDIGECGEQNCKICVRSSDNKINWIWLFHDFVVNVIKTILFNWLNVWFF